MDVLDDFVSSDRNHDLEELVWLLDILQDRLEYLKCVLPEVNCELLSGEVLTIGRGISIVKSNSTSFYSDYLSIKLQIRATFKKVNALLTYDTWVSPSRNSFKEFGNIQENDECYMQYQRSSGASISLFQNTFPPCSNRHIMSFYTSSGMSAFVCTVIIMKAYLTEQDEIYVQDGFYFENVMYLESMKIHFRRVSINEIIEALRLKKRIGCIFIGAEISCIHSNYRELLQEIDNYKSKKMLIIVWDRTIPVLDEKIETWLNKTHRADRIVAYFESILKLHQAGLDLVSSGNLSINSAITNMKGFKALVNQTRNLTSSRLDPTSELNLLPYRDSVYHRRYCRICRNSFMLIRELEKRTLLRKYVSIYNINNNQESLQIIPIALIEFSTPYASEHIEKIINSLCDDQGMRYFVVEVRALGSIRQE